MEKSRTHKRRFGDRKDGRRLRTLAPYYRITSFMMPTRNDSTNYYDDRFEISAAEALIRKLKSEDGYTGISILHIFIAAYIRVVSEFPAINRFIAGQRVFARNKITVAMVVKKALSPDASETNFRIDFVPTDTLFDVHKRVEEEIQKIKSGESGNKAEDTAKTLIKLPRLLLKFVVWLLKLMDYFGVLPQSIIDASLFHSSLVISDLGSVGIGKIFHHLYNFGNLPILLAFGKKYGIYELDKEGKPAERRYIDYGVATDERICDGYYYALSFRHLNHYLHKPEILLTPPKEVKEDID
ncbi:MAG: hypothetical protein LBC38_03725 [Oscillospiraceae bacterium]|jgi:hypothetical protein|nr:hypothetical protein [Oscillospiraceae bacterium]